KGPGGCVGAVAVVTTALSTLVGCASGGPVRIARCGPAVGPPSRADALVRQGCYECLLKARDAYEGLATQCETPDIVVSLFETQLLVALRERELGIDDRASTAAAEQVAARVPAVVDARRYLRIVAAIRP